MSDKNINEYKEYYSEKRNEALNSMESYNRLVEKSDAFRRNLNEGQSKRISKKILLDVLFVFISFLAFLFLGYISKIPFTMYALISISSMLFGFLLFGFVFTIPSVIGCFFGLGLLKNH